MNDDQMQSFPAFHSRSAELTDADRARVRLAEATRRFMLGAFMSDADVHHIEEAISALERAVEVVSGPGSHQGVAAAHSHFTDRSPFYGAMNPLSMPMSLEVEGSFGEFGRVLGRATFTDLYEGPPGHVHGGFVAAAFDEVLGMAQSLTGRPGMTGRLSVSYRSPTPLHKDIVFTGWVDRIEGRKIFTVGTAHDGDTLCAEAEGLFLSFPPEMLNKLRKGRDLSGPSPT